MNFHENFRRAWWVILLLALTWLLIKRYPALIAGNATPADVVLFLVWVALALVPVFSEVTLLGLRFKQDLRDIKNDVDGLRADIHTSVEIRNQVGPTILFPTLPPDQLDALAGEVRRRAEATLPKKLGAPPDPGQLVRQVPDDATFLFQVRYALDSELRRLYRAHVGSTEEQRPLPLSQLTRALVRAEVIEFDAATAAEELYRIASRVMHGAEVLPVQLKFARDVSGWLLAELRDTK